MPILEVPLLVQSESLEPLEKRATLDNVIIKSPEISLVREKTGVLNLVSLLPDTPRAPTPKKAPPRRGLSFRTYADYCFSRKSS